MRLARSRILITGGVSLLLVLGILFLSRKVTQLQSTHPAPPAPGPGITIPTMNLYGHSPTGAREWTLTAQNVTISPDQRMLHSEGLRDGAFYRGKDIVARFKAGSATFDRSTEVLDLGGVIQVDAVNGVHLRSSTLHYTPITHRFIALQTTISTPQSTFTAGMLNADLALSELTFLGTPGQPVLLTSRTGLKGLL